MRQLLKSVPTPAKSKTSTSVPEVDMSPDQLSMDNAPGVANGVRRGVGLGNGLRSEVNLAKRAARRSPTPTSKSTTSTTTVVGRQRSVGPGAKKKIGDKDQKKAKEKEGEEGKLGNGVVQMAVQRRSGRKKPVVDEKAKVVKKRTKGKVDKEDYYYVASDTDGERAEKARKKTSREPEGWEKEFLRDLESDMESLESDGSDLGFKVTSTADKPARKPTIATKTMTKVPTKDNEAPAEDTATLAKDTADLGRTTRNSRSAAATDAAVENGKKAEKDGETEPASVIGTWRERKSNEQREVQEEVSSKRSTSGESASNKGSQKGSDKTGPQVVDDMDCEKEDELYWPLRTPFKAARRKPVQVYKSAKGKRREVHMFMNGRMFYLFHSMVYIGDR